MTCSHVENGMLTLQTRSLLVLSQAPKMVSVRYETNMQAIPRCELLNEMQVEW
jgi:hypothetical protein